MNLRRWLTVGIGVKRWLLLAFTGLLLLAIGVAHLLRQVTRDLRPGGPAQASSTWGRCIPAYQARGLVAGVLGASLFLAGAYRLVRALVDPFALWDRDQPMVEVIYQKRYLARGPRVVAIGGGTGLSTLLRGLKEHTSNLTAVVTVADDGGSSGVLRSELGIPAVGDIRNCIVALADAEPLMGRLLQYRFPGSGPATHVDPEAPRSRDPETPSAGLGGHAVGNLLLAALVALEAGDFEEGVREMNRVLAVRGRVVPATSTASRSTRGSATGRVGGAEQDREVGRRGPGVGHARRRRRHRRGAAGDRRGGADRPGARQPVHEPAAGAARPGRAGGHRRVGGARRVRLQRGDSARRDRRVRPGGPPRRLDRHGAPTCRTSCWPTTGRRPGAACWSAERCGCAGHGRHGGGGPSRRGSSSRTSRTRQCHHHDPAAPRRSAPRGPGARGRAPSPWRRPARHPTA